MSPLAAIALFTYNRPAHTRQTVAALRANPLAASSELHVFSDGPKTQEAALRVREVRAYLRTIDGFGAVKVYERERNFGLAASVIDGVTRLCDASGMVIVVEDDLLVSPRFLGYMNAALDRYCDEAEVMQVSGYMFPVDMGAATDSFFLPFTTSWGWGTWARAWKTFDPLMRGLGALSGDRRLKDAFNLHGAYDYYGMLRRQQRGEVDSWAIRWYLSVFMRNGLTLYPAKTLVQNTGFDGSGTHCGAGDFGQATGLPDFQVSSFPERVELYPEWRRVLAGLPKRSHNLRYLAGTLLRRVHRAIGTRNSN
ncbi:MAG: glycosyltransferase [Burkholderiales bacterium]